MNQTSPTMVPDYSTKSCRVPMYDGRPCGRKCVSSFGCILHDRNVAKREEAFQEEANAILADSKGTVYDFTSAQFPRGFRFKSRVFEKVLVLEKAQLVEIDTFDLSGAIFKEAAIFRQLRAQGDLILTGSKFEFGLDMREAHVGGKCDLSKTICDEVFDLSECKFGAEFHAHGCQFKGIVNLSKCEFGGNAHFSACEFSSELDATRCKFGGSAFFDGSEFDKGANFVDSVVTGEFSFTAAEAESSCAFGNCTFVGESDFSSTRMRDKLDFNGAVFKGDTHFSGLTVQGMTDFSRSRFVAHARFYDAHFGVDFLFDSSTLESNASVSFDCPQQHKSVFAGKADFRLVTLLQGSTLSFRNMDLTRCEFLETDVSRIEFVACNWIKTGWPQSRIMVADELSEGSNEEKLLRYTLIADLYRRLQVNFDRIYKHSEAGDFHVGEQIMMRKASSHRKAYWWFNWAYNIFARYGENPVVPGLWLSALLLATPLVYVAYGVNFDPSCDKLTFGLSLSDGQPFLISRDYWNAFFKNVSFIAFNKGDMAQFIQNPIAQGLITLQSLIVAVLITFLVLALRRKFKRKSF